MDGSGMKCVLRTAARGAELLSVLFLTLVAVSCGSDAGSFKIDGRLQNLNQGEFYVYSPDGVIDGIDTIFVLGGRFAYKGSCDRRGTLVIVFPNFSEQPVFVQPGKNVRFRGDVSHLKELRVTGTRDNKLMNMFREETKDTPPEEMKNRVKEFAAGHPESLAAVWLVTKYFVRTARPDYVSAAEMLSAALAAQPDNGLLAQSLKAVKERASTSEGKTLPHFRAVTLSGETVTDKSLSRGESVIYLWASYDFESCNIQRVLKNCDQRGLSLLGVCLDTSAKDCRRVVERDKIETPVVCDSAGFEGRLVGLLGMSSLPDNMILRNGKIVARGLTSKEMRERFPAVPKKTAGTEEVR